MDTNRNRLGHLGVTYQAGRNRYRARVRCNGKAHVRFAKTADGAAALYEQMRTEIPKKEREKQETQVLTEQDMLARAVNEEAWRIAYEAENRARRNKRRAERKMAEKAADPEAYKEKVRQERIRNAEAYRERNRANYKKHREQILAKHAAFKLNNPEEYSERRRHYYEKHKDIAIKRAAQRRARKLGAIPKWRKQETDAKFLALRKEAKKRYKETGIRFHVDHIIPLSGTIGKVRLVCGLHVDYNFQLLSQEDNIKKGCYEWPDMPSYTQVDLKYLRKLHRVVTKEEHDGRKNENNELQIT